jgi:hypothetical protein
MTARPPGRECLFCGHTIDGGLRCAGCAAQTHPVEWHNGQSERHGWVVGDPYLAAPGRVECWAAVDAEPDAAGGQMLALLAHQDGQWCEMSRPQVASG